MNLGDLARQSLTYFVKHRRYMPSPKSLGRRAGCFVSLHTDNGDLRGCIGTIQPVCEDLALEIARNAVSAGTTDPRFDKVREQELAHLVFEVSVMGEPEAVGSIADLDVKRYGVIVQNGTRRGLLLPDLEGIDSAEQQVAIAKREADIPLYEDVELMRFEVERHHETS